MTIVENIKLTLKKAINNLGIEVDINDIVVMPTNDNSYGDFSSNAAMKFSKLFKKNPLETANNIVDALDKTLFSKVEIAGPGFINFFLKSDSLTSIISQIVNDGDNFGKGDKKNKRINVEFVSANPTGDLHVGHARGAAVGDSICRILEFYGYDVDREYYINDAGSQITNLGLSLEARYNELLGKNYTLPEDGYHGEDVKIIAKEILDEYGDALMSNNDHLSFFKSIGVKKELDKIKQDLQLFRVKFDIFSSEITIRSNNAIEQEIKFLDKHIYEKEGALILSTSKFLDDKDRVIVKSNGDYTYFLPDIVYHVNKVSRGYDKLIDILGADHHGYINRMKSALMMHGNDKDILDIELIQMVRFIKDGVEKKASKRTGDAYTLKELCEDVGVDAARYFFAMRAPSTHLDFDLDLANKQSSDNPVYYSQYAHARMSSVLKLGQDIKLELNGNLLTGEKEKKLLKILANFPKAVESAANELAPYKITNYVHELSEAIHTWYNDCKIVDKTNLELSANRLALCLASKQVIKNALSLIGVSSPEHM